MTNLVQTIVQGLLLGGVYALAASGLTLVFGVMNVVNVAHGALIILSAYVTWQLWLRAGIDPLLAVFITTPAMFALGWVIYQLTIRRIRNAPVAMSVLLTFAIALIIEGSIGLAWTGIWRSVTPSYFNEALTVGPISISTARLYACGTAVVVLAGLWLILARTWTGRAIRAAAQNAQGAMLMGINTAAVAALAFALGVATTGAAGSLIAVLYPFLPASHYGWISRLLGIIVLGGMGSLAGATVGALLIGVGETLTTAYISPQWQSAVAYVVIFVVLLLRPQGLLGSRTREDVAVA